MYYLHGLRSLKAHSTPIFVIVHACTSTFDFVLIVTSSLQDGRTALMWASGRGHVECVKVLLDKGAQANQRDKVSAIPDQTNVCC